MCPACRRVLSVHHVTYPNPARLLKDWYDLWSNEEMIAMYYKFTILYFSAYVPCMSMSLPSYILLPVFNTLVIHMPCMSTSLACTPHHPQQYLYKFQFKFLYKKKKIKERVYFRFPVPPHFQLCRVCIVLFSSFVLRARARATLKRCFLAVFVTPSS